MNARQEFLDKTSTINSKVKCVSIEIGDPIYDKENVKKCYLKCNYSSQEYEKFLKKLDVTYDDGYGSQELFGHIWFEDGTWFYRTVCDGSEWWSHAKVPEIPENLK